MLSTKAGSIKEEMNDRYIAIGPDVYRETSDHPEFMEDRELFSEWRNKAAEEGLLVRTGRWKIDSEPITILIDFTSFFNRKDKIFSKLWELYKLDSLSGQWDYIEPSLFGYATGMTIESFIRFYGLGKKKIAAHFHEWMTGAGLLYLKENQPQVGTVFTTHATVVGRAIAGQGLPLYSKLNTYNGDEKARELGVTAKQSLEKLTAHQAYAFSTVSDTTARECAQFLGKPIDLTTPNGFSGNFLPDQNSFNSKREAARKKLLEVASAIIGERLPQDTLLIANSSRYEFRNKGTDLFIDALGMLNKVKEFDKTVVAFILVPANQYGPRKDIQEVIEGNRNGTDEKSVLTHYLHFAEQDPVLQRISQNGLSNADGDPVKIIFVPSYLKGNDGIIDLSYYDALIGFDLTFFPSYYEPWGYTPLESMALRIPAVTTSLSGFGKWVNDHVPDKGKGIFIVERKDSNEQEVVAEMAQIIQDYVRSGPEDIKRAREKAYEISQSVVWKNMIPQYWRAYSIALERAGDVDIAYDSHERVEHLPSTSKLLTDIEPMWRRVVVQQQIPERLKPLEKLSRNLWWSWNREAVDLFRSVDPDLWDDVDENPIVLLDRIPFDRLLELEKDEKFIEKLEEVFRTFREYMEEAPRKNEPSVSYFSMEFGLHNSLKIYSGGLGLLAGDYLKEASDYNYNLVGVGLLYRYGYFHQLITSGGDQVAHDDFQDFSKIPVSPVRDESGTWRTISLILPGRTLHARIWKVQIGRVPLFLLDADFEANKPNDRQVTHKLYGGDEENRFKQELLLGIGGVRALRQQGIQTDLYHLNEGHAAFTGFERLREYIQERNMTFPEAREIVRSTSLFTTHTPVPAGHDSFNENMMRTYLSHYPDRLTITWNKLMNLGRVKHDEVNEKFSMSVLAVNLSQEVNGVSNLHGSVSRNMFAGMWNGYMPEELHIGHVTNGVHLSTWLSDNWRELYKKEFGDDFLERQEDRKLWHKIHDVKDETIWKLRNEERKQLVGYIRRRLSRASERLLEDPKLVMEISEAINEKTLTIGFARRFATYKRSNLLFADIERLKKLVNNPEMPVQFVFAGKAHPKDIPGQALIKRIVEISKRPEFTGKIIFLQNYNIHLAKRLLHGVDIWLNTPTRPLEASGTSGEKAVMNGCLHFSVLDGWWAEGYREDAGWALPVERSFDNQDQQDELDAERIYSLLENDILPKFYKRNKDDVPVEWVKIIKNSISKVAPEFTMNRMLRDYIEKFYKRLYHRSQSLKMDDFRIAKEISFYKKQVIEQWQNINIIKFDVPDPGKEDFVVGQRYEGSIQLDLNGLSADNIGVEMVIAGRSEDQDEHVFMETVDLKCINFEDSIAEYEIIQEIGRTGQFDIGYRIYPKMKELPHRMDLPLVRWI